MAPTVAYTVDPADLTTLGTSFSDAVPGTASDVASVVGTLGIATGNAALDARITALAGQVATSLAGAGLRLTDDSWNLALNAGIYAGADRNSVPQLTFRPSLFDTP
jgi:hypothetical protein